MTEINERNALSWPPATRMPVDAKAFTIAATLTPFVFGVSGVIIMGYGIFFTLGAAIIGFPAYLLFGLPSAYIALGRLSDGSRSGDYGTLLIVGILANAGSFVLAYLFQLNEGSPYADPIEDALIYAGLGLIAGPVQALIFGWLYRLWAREPERNTKIPKQTKGVTPCV